MTAVMLSAWISRACSGSRFFGSAHMRHLQPTAMPLEEAIAADAFGCANHG